MKRMKILIVGFTKIKYMPYMNFYLDNIDVSRNDVHLLYWNRDLTDEDTMSLDITLHEFKCYQEDDASKLSKLSSFRKYRIFALKLLKEHCFDFIIVLHSLPGVLIAGELKKNYQHKYIFDYRDSTYEAFRPFKSIVADLVKGSCATFVSSDAFRRFLPQSESAKIFTSHNILIDSLSHREEKEKHGIPSDKIRISFWGFIRHEKINREIIRKIAADKRFQLHYYCREQQIALNLKQYAKEIGAVNVFFHGEYKPENRYEFVRKTDIIHNIYYDKNTMLAMGNKYYDGLIFRIPQICMKDSYMAEQAAKYGTGFACNPYDNDFAKQVFQYYQAIERDSFRKNCDSLLKNVLAEYQASLQTISTVLEERM